MGSTNTKHAHGSRVRLVARVSSKSRNQMIARLMGFTAASWSSLMVKPGANARDPVQK